MDNLSDKLTGHNKYGNSGINPAKKYEKNIMPPALIERLGETSTVFVYSSAEYSQTICYFAIDKYHKLMILFQQRIVLQADCPFHRDIVK